MVVYGFRFLLIKNGLHMAIFVDENLRFIKHKENF